MNLQSILNALQIVVALLLITTILLQSRGSGLSGVFGGDSAVYRTKRGAEKILFYSTIILSILFLGITSTNLFI